MCRIILTDGNQICSATSCHVTRLRTVDMQYSRKQSYIETRKDWLQENCSVSDGERAAGTRITSTWFVYPVLWAILATNFSFLLCRFRHTPEALAQQSDQLVCVIFSMRIGVTMGKNGCTARDRENKSPTIASCFTEFDTRESRSLGFIGAEVRMHL